MADKKEKEVEETSLAGRAWNATKEENDPTWAEIPNQEFKGKQEHAAERAKATGSTLTNFDIAAKELGAEDMKNETAPMAVVVETAPNAVAPEAAPKVPAKVKAAAKKSSAKKAASKKTAAKLDKSGRILTGAEVSAAKKAEETNPVHP